MPAGERGKRRNGGIHDVARRDIGVARHRADDDRVALATNARELGEAAEVDQRGGRSEPLLHRRDQRHAAGKRLGVVFGEVGDRAAYLIGTGVVESVHERFSEGFMRDAR